MAASGQEFIDRNRPPRVQITYDVFTTGEKAVELPFVIGVMSDLTGKADDGDVPEADQKYRGQASNRDFINVDVDNFDQTMEKMKPRAAFQVPNTLGVGEGEEATENLSVDLSFSSMDDFSPAAIAQKVEPIKKLYDARNQLKTLLGYMDGKDKAEKVLEDLLKNEALMKAITGGE